MFVQKITTCSMTINQYRPVYAQSVLMLVQLSSMDDVGLFDGLAQLIGALHHFWHDLEYITIIIVILFICIQLLTQIFCHLF